MGDESEGKSIKKSKIWMIGGGAIGGVILVWVTNLIIGLLKFGNKDGVGTFGDMFGAANALFSGLAFAGLIITILLQREDLKLQYETLDSQLKEMKDQSRASKESAKQFELQLEITRREYIRSNVNNLINIKNYIMEKYKVITYDYDDETRTIYEGVEGMTLVLTTLKYDKNEKDNLLYSNPTIKRYIETIKYTLQFIQDSDTDDLQKKLLADSLNLQMLDSELVLIYRCFTDENQHYLALLKRYGFYDRYKDLYPEQSIASTVEL